jgi:hypothetical protein
MSTGNIEITDAVLMEEKKPTYHFEELVDSLAVHVQSLKESVTRQHEKMEKKVQELVDATEGMLNKAESKAKVSDDHSLLKELTAITAQQKIQGPKLEELERKLHAELGAARMGVQDVTDGEKGLAEKRLDGLQSEVRDLKEVLMQTLNQVFDGARCNLRSRGTNSSNCDH